MLAKEMVSSKFLTHGPLAVAVPSSSAAQRGMGSGTGLAAGLARERAATGWTTIVRMFDRARAVAQIETGKCACGGCRGELTDAALSRGNWRFCRVCRCAWKISALDGHTYATAIPSSAHAIQTKESETHP